MTKTCKKILSYYEKAPAEHIHPSLAKRIGGLRFCDGVDARLYLRNILKECENDKTLCSDFVRTSIGVAIEMDALWA